MERKLNAKITDQWDRLKLMLSTVEDDVYKSARGNSSAGIRARKTLRSMKQELSVLVKTMIAEGKLSRAASKEAHDAEASETVSQ